MFNVSVIQCFMYKSVMDFSKFFKMHDSSLDKNVIISVGEIMLVTLPSHLCTLMVILVGKMCAGFSHTCSEETCVPNVCNVVNKRKIAVFVKEFILIVALLTLVTTIFSGSLSYVIISLLVINAVLLFFVIQQHYSKTNFYNYSLQDIYKLPILGSRRAYITCCRSIVNIMTVISILAVDFRIFPHRFSKTGKYGMSLMDVGVGFFILSNAAVLKLEKIMKQGFVQCLIGSSVLFVIGVLRLVSVKEIDYGVNVSEYGLHWNFFFTLGLVRVLTFALLYIFKCNASLCSIFLCVFHQCILSIGLEEYALGDGPRENIIDANREGLISTLGYTSLYLIGVSLNKFIVKTTTNVKGDLKSVGKLVTISLILFAFSVFVGAYFPPCRRVVNITYISWVLTAAVAHVAVSLIVELLIVCFVLPSTMKERFYSHLTPLVFEAVNMNGLFFFLLGNILTGMVNIAFSTRKLNSVQSILILMGYMMLNCATVTVMYFRKITFRFW